MVICEYAVYKRGSDAMPKRGNSNSRGNIEVENNIKDENKVKFVNQIKVAVASSIICSLLAGAVGSVLMLTRLQANVENMQSDMLELKTDMASMSTDVRAISDRMIVAEKDISRISKLEDKISEIESMVYLGAAKTLIPTENAMSSIGIEYGVSKLQYNFSEPKWEDIEVIAKDIKTGEEYNAEDLAGKKIILPYKNGNQDVLFYGEFNENNSWDGNCIINVYDNDHLVLIMDAEYDNGDLLRYQQIIPYTVRTGEDVWIISNRVNMGEFNSGENWNYIRTNEIKKDFELNNVTEDSIINVELFKLKIDSCLESYYHGNTSDGYYNDDTGTAYWVKYAVDGTVRTLYVGRFRDGNFQDDTGNAWYITREEDTEYMYFKGVFKDGRTKEENKEVPFENPVYIERITEITQGYAFKCELKWFDTRIIY